MRRKGSPWAGVGVVLAKETADHFSGWLVWIIVALLFLTALAAAYTAIATIRQTIGESPFLFLRLLMLRNAQFRWSFIDLVGILVPLVAIALGFDTVGGEFNRRTLSRLLAQPIYRDALLLGKFLAGLLTLAICLLALWLLVIGAGLVLLGVPPNGAETVRMLGFLVATIVYGGVWLALAMLFSTLFRAPAPAFIAAAALWLLFLLFWDTDIAPLLASLFAGPPQDIFGPRLPYLETVQSLARISPHTLYNEIALALLHPSTRSLGPVFLSQLQGAILGAPLPTGQSFLLVWPQLAGLGAGMILIFAIAYVAFQRQEIRA
ncbi:MAG: ABC transporter permease [Stellaceae bacterium]